MSRDQEPFVDVRFHPDGSFSIPELKWRELVFVGALRAEGDLFVRDTARPLPPFQATDLFSPDVRLALEGREEGRVRLRRV